MLVPYQANGKIYIGRCLPRSADRLDPCFKCIFYHSCEDEIFDEYRYLASVKEQWYIAGNNVIYTINDN